jgi:ribonuclease BN (tRNA processing enzyme)
MQVGGNTSCVQVLTDLDDLIVLDAGTGIRLLSRHLINEQQHRKRRIHLLLSHTHWDHIQGLPFFGMMNFPDNEITIYGADKPHKTLEEVVRAQMHYEYFPIGLHEAAAEIAFKPIDEQGFALGPIKVKTARFNHPGGVNGYRFEYQGQVLVYATDMEYTQDSLDQKLIDFARGADLLIYDAQYTPEEYCIKQGWGHSNHMVAAHLAREAGVGQLYLFSHDPEHSDQTLETMEAEARAHFPATYLAREGLVVNVGRAVVSEPKA